MASASASAVNLSYDSKHPSVGIITMKAGKNSENAFNAKLVDDMNRCLDEFEKSDDGRALVFTGDAKFFSNGLDLQWFSTLPKAEDAQQFIITKVWRVLGRIMTFGVPTVAAINGHAFGAGFFLALCCDYRIQHSSKGFLCFPEVSLGMRLSDGFNVIAQTKLTRNALRDGVLLGKRWSAAEALASGVIDKSSADPLTDAVALASTMTNIQSQRSVVSTLKQELYWDAYKVLRSQTELALIGIEPGAKVEFPPKKKGGPKSKL